MQTPGKRELQQISFNPLSYIDFEDFINLYKKNNAKPYSSLVNDTSIRKSFAFQKQFFTKNIKTNHDK